MSSGVAEKNMSVPTHVAIIMDGNGRWARERGLPHLAGHKAGAEAVARCVRAAMQRGVPYLTLYAFSSENWSRGPQEVSDLTSLLRYYLRHKVRELHAKGVRLRFIGELDRFESSLRHELDRAEAMTRDNTGMVLLLALSYGGRCDIVQSARALARAVKAGALAPDDITDAWWPTICGRMVCPTPMWWCAPAGNTGSPIFCCGRVRMPNWCFWMCTGPTLPKGIFLQC